MTFSLTLAVVGVLSGLAVFALEIRKTTKIIKAEGRLAKLLRIQFKQKELEKLRDELLEVKQEAIRIQFNEMDRIYSIEHKINLIAAKLDAHSQRLIAEGLRQGSERGRVEYMLKLVNMGIGFA